MPADWYMTEKQKLSSLSILRCILSSHLGLLNAFQFFKKETNKWETCFWQVFLLVKFWREGTVYLEELFYKGMTLVSQQLKFHLNSSFNTNLEKNMLQCSFSVLLYNRCLLKVVFCAHIFWCRQRKLKHCLRAWRWVSPVWSLFFKEESICVLYSELNKYLESNRFKVA